MGCLDHAIDGKCCLPSCREKVTNETPGYLSDALTKIETRTGTHYVCDDCLEEQREKYENGDLDIFEVLE